MTLPEEEEMLIDFENLLISLFNSQVQKVHSPPFKEKSMGM